MVVWLALSVTGTPDKTVAYDPHASARRDAASRVNSAWAPGSGILTEPGGLIKAPDGAIRRLPRPICFCLLVFIT